MNIDFNKLIERVKLVLTDPKGAWDVISAEDTSQRDLATNILVPLVLAAAVVQLVAGIISGVPFGYAIVTFVVQLLLGVAVPFLFAIVLRLLAPHFGGETTDRRAFSFVVHSAIAAQIGGLFVIIPYLGAIIGLLFAVYGIYIFFVGISKMTGVPEDRKIGYAIVSILALVVIYFIIAAVVGGILFSLVAPAALVVPQSFTIPG